MCDYLLTEESRNWDLRSYCWRRNGSAEISRCVLAQHLSAKSTKPIYCPQKVEIRKAGKSAKYGQEEQAQKYVLYSDVK